MVRAGDHVHRVVHDPLRRQHRRRGPAGHRRRPASELLAGAVGAGGLPAGGEHASHSRREARRLAGAGALLPARDSDLRPRFHTCGTCARRRRDDPRALHSGRRRSVHVLDRGGDHHRGISAFGPGPRSGAQRHGGLRGSHPGTGHRRPDSQPRELAVDLLHQRTHRGGHDPGRLGAPAGRAARSPGVPTAADPDRLGGSGVAGRGSRYPVHPPDLLAPLGLGERQDDRPTRAYGRVLRGLRSRGGQGQGADARPRPAEEEPRVRGGELCRAPELPGRVRRDHPHRGLPRDRPGPFSSTDRPAAAYATGTDGRPLAIHRPALRQGRLPRSRGRGHGARGGRYGATCLRVELDGAGPCRSGHCRRGHGGVQRPEHFRGHGLGRPFATEPRIRLPCDDEVHRPGALDSGAGGHRRVEVGGRRGPGDPARRVGGRFERARLRCRLRDRHAGRRRLGAGRGSSVLDRQLRAPPPVSPGSVGRGRRRARISIIGPTAEEQ